jgi:hypothetical protein
VSGAHEDDGVRKENDGRAELEMGGCAAIAISSIWSLLLRPIFITFTTCLVYQLKNHENK